jgi:pimeloyl-ACP methyl ester carboxylesterase
MVGASRGGLYVRLFQAEYRADVAGLVLVDPAAEDRLFTMYQGKPQTGAPFDRLPSDLYARRRICSATCRSSC